MVVLLPAEVLHQAALSLLRVLHPGVFRVLVLQPEGLLDQCQLQDQDKWALLL